MRKLVVAAAIALSSLASAPSAEATCPRAPAFAPSFINPTRCIGPIFTAGSGWQKSKTYQGYLYHVNGWIYGWGIQLGSTIWGRWN